MTRLTLNTSQLEIGDVVNTDGMRVLIESKNEPYSNQGRTVYGYEGKVLNRAEVLAVGLITPGLLQRREWISGRGMTVVQDDYWYVQGNDTVSWDVER